MSSSFFILDKDQQGRLLLLILPLLHFGWHTHQRFQNLEQFRSSEVSCEGNEIKTIEESKRLLQSELIKLKNGLIAYLGVESSLLLQGIARFCIPLQKCVGHCTELQGIHTESARFSIPAQLG